MAKSIDARVYPRSGGKQNVKSGKTKGQEIREGGGMMPPPRPRNINGDGYIGPIGQLIKEIAPNTEADPNALLVQALTIFGNIVGRSPTLQVEATPHRTNLFALVVGDTSKSRKGTSLDWIEKFFAGCDRVGLDIWPAAEVLEKILALLRPFTEKGGKRKAPRRVAWYCLAEIFRAGAVETGFVEEPESLPTEIDVDAYRLVLQAEAARLASISSSTLPWYLKQQVLLFLAASGAKGTPMLVGAETRRYRDLLHFLAGENKGTSAVDFAILAILARRSFLGQMETLGLIGKSITPRRLEQIAERDPAFGIEILSAKGHLAPQVSPRLRDDLCLGSSPTSDSDGWVSLASIVLTKTFSGPLRNERSSLSFAIRFLEQWIEVDDISAITPINIELKLASDGVGASVSALRIIPTRVASSGSLYETPAWCPRGERWRLALGYLLRFILTAREDFSKIVRPPHWKDEKPIYQAPSSHWQQRFYGLFNGHAAFGDDWLPISDWMERFVTALLVWPGCRKPDMFEWVFQDVKTVVPELRGRLKKLDDEHGTSSRTLMLQMTPYRHPPFAESRPLRACILQTAFPTLDRFKQVGDLTLSRPLVRWHHRNHLSSALAAVDRMLHLRETHKELDGRLDWLILPELAVHPRDVRSHLLPFARAHKCIILAGLTYEHLDPAEPMVNSAIWIVPSWTPNNGLQMMIRRQGKQHLAPLERTLNANGPVVQGFRPCQWLVGYEWSAIKKDPRLWLTASICYDATDLRLASDLRQRSDVFAIPALNKDITTFDQMAQALHYHMFQLVIVANTGEFGGSNAYAPYAEGFQRQVFHLHGQPQASIAFAELDNVQTFLDRKNNATKVNGWKPPPAGY